MSLIRKLVVAVVLVAVVAGLTTYLVVHRRAQHTACAGGATPAAAGPGVTLSLPSHPRVLVFGDSYTAGTGAEHVRFGYARTVAGLLGWDVTVDGSGGTGYVAVGPRRQGDYLTRLASAPQGPFDLVLLQGSSNDTRQPLARLQPAADAMLQAVRLRYPTAQLAMLGPVALYGTAPRSYQDVDAVLAREAAAQRVTYIDPIAEHWFLKGESRTMANPANGHPSNAGHARIAQRLAQDVNRGSSPASPECAPVS